MKKVLLVFGTRPEAIKMAPLVKVLEADAYFDSKVCVTAQHREMLDQVLSLFDIVPDYDLNIMKQGQDLYDITTNTLMGLRDVLRDFKPDIVLVHGDTTTTMSASLAAFYEQIPIGHVEAGLRTGNLYSPYPEEANRKITDAICDYYFAPTTVNMENLLNENIDPKKIFITGNTVIDALLMTIDKECSFDGLGMDKVNWDKKIVLLTCHRRENWGDPMREIFSAVRELKEGRDDIEVVFPVHKNPKVRELANSILGDVEGVHLIEPLEYLQFSHLINKSYLVLTDSGGIQEEAPSLGKPVLVLRDTTERPEAVDAGTVRIVGTSKDKILSQSILLLDNNIEYLTMSQKNNPYGDGNTSRCIANILKENTINMKKN